MRRRAIGLLALYCFLAAVVWGALCGGAADAPALPESALVFPDI